MALAILVEIPLYYKTKEDILNEKRGIYLGNAILMESGYYAYQSGSPCFGLFEAWSLIEIANQLNELNKEWDEQVKRDLGDGK